jgi:8-oxo-dGTP diphosphatase
MSGESMGKPPVLAVGGVVLDRGSVCLVRRAHPPMQGRWSLPGGRVEAGESLADALCRELVEETGLVVEPGPLVEVVEIVNAVGHWVVIDYLCRVIGGDLAAGDDASDVAMVPFGRLDDFEVTDAVAGVLSRARRLQDDGA